MINEGRPNRGMQVLYKSEVDASLRAQPLRFEGFGSLSIPVEEKLP